jgi:hypothetical protein
MQTRTLIDHLSRDLKPVRPRSFFSDARVLVILLVIELGLYLGARMARPDIAFAIHLPTFWWKLLSLGLIGAVGAAATILSVDPTGTSRASLRFILALVAMSFLSGWVFCMPHWLPVPASHLNPMQGLHCVYSIVLLSIPFVIGLGLVLRRGAPTDIEGTASIAGIAAAAWGAFIFTFACPIDDPFYIALCYSVGCGAVLVYSRRIFKYIARW